MIARAQAAAMASIANLKADAATIRKDLQNDVARVRTLREQGFQRANALAVEASKRIETLDAKAEKQYQSILDQSAKEKIARIMQMQKLFKKIEKLASEITVALLKGLWVGVRANLNAIVDTIIGTISLGFAPPIHLFGGQDSPYYQSAYFSARVGWEIAAALLTGGASVYTKIGKIVYIMDMAGNAMSFIRGAYDASQNGLDGWNTFEMIAGGAGFSAGGLSRARALGKTGANTVKSAAKTVDDLVPRATVGSSLSKNYRKTFFDAHPHLKGKVIVHHAIEQQVFKRYPGRFTESEIHSLENLRGIPNSINADIHLSKIRKAWNRFYKANPDATRQQLLDEATRIDRLFGSQFDSLL